MELVANLGIWFLLLNSYVHAVVPQIANLNVMCDTDGMSVSVEFDRPFNGIIFSKGYYGDLNCRYVKEKSDEKSFRFQVPASGCGTSSVVTDNKDSRQFENVVIFQNDPIYQEVWDSARLLSCRYLLASDVPIMEKKVVFKPFQVDMLDVITVPMADFAGDEHKVDCWMDVTKGKFPSLSPISGAVKVGENLTLAIYIRDSRKNTDIRVKDCYAYDNEQALNDKNPALLQLSSEDGCPLKPKLMDVWRRTNETSNTGATVIAYTTVTAFKFPEHSNVHLTCNVELCKKECAERCPMEQQKITGLGGSTEDRSEDGDDMTESKDEADAESGDSKKSKDGDEDSEDVKPTTSTPPKRGTDEEDEGDGEAKTDSNSASSKDEDEDEDKDSEKSDLDESKNDSNRGERNLKKDGAVSKSSEDNDEKDDESSSGKKESSIEFDEKDEEKPSDEKKTKEEDSEDDEDKSSNTSNKSDDKDEKSASKEEDDEETDENKKENESEGSSKRNADSSSDDADDGSDDEEAEESRSSKLLRSSRSKIKKSIRTGGNRNSNSEDSDDSVFLSGGLRSLVKSSSSKVTTTTTPYPKTPLIIVIKSDKPRKLSKPKQVTREENNSNGRTRNRSEGSFRKSQAPSKKRKSAVELRSSATTSRPRTTTEVITASAPRFRTLVRSSRLDDEPRLVDKKKFKAKKTTTTTPRTTTEDKDEEEEESISVKPTKRIAFSTRNPKRFSVRTRKSIHPSELKLRSLAPRLKSTTSKPDSPSSTTTTTTTKTPSSKRSLREMQASRYMSNRSRSKFFSRTSLRSSIRTSTTSTSTTAKPLPENEEENSGFNDIVRPVRKSHSSTTSPSRKWDGDALFNPLSEIELYEPVRIQKNSRIRRSIHVLFEPRQIFETQLKYRGLSVTG